MQKMSKNNWISFKIVPQGHHNCQLSTVNCQLSIVNCQLSIVNCQFGEAAKFQFVDLLREADMHIIPKAAERKPPPLFRQGFYVSSLGQLIARIFSIAMCSTWQVGVEAAL